MTDQMTGQETRVNQLPLLNTAASPCSTDVSLSLSEGDGSDMNDLLCLPRLLHCVRRTCTGRPGRSGGRRQHDVSARHQVGDVVQRYLQQSRTY